MERSICQDLDTAGMQPHSREYLERMVNEERSRHEAAMTPGVLASERMYDGDVPCCGYDHPGPMPGIHYGYTP